MTIEGIALFIGLCFSSLTVISTIGLRMITDALDRYDKFVKPRMSLIKTQISSSKELVETKQTTTAHEKKALRDRSQGFLYSCSPVDSASISF